MRATTLLSVAVAALSARIGAQELMVPVPWDVTNLNMYNIRHGTGGTYVFSLLSLLCPLSHPWKLALT